MSQAQSFESVESIQQMVARDPALQASLKQAESPEQVASVLSDAAARHGVAIDPNLVTTVFRARQAELAGELDDAALEDVSGGSRIFRDDPPFDPLAIPKAVNAVGNFMIELGHTLTFGLGRK